MGWEIGSREAATYVHLSGRDMDQAINKLHGIAEEKDEESKFKVITCPRCGIQNSPESKACPHCGIPLDLQSVMDYEKTSKTALKQMDDTKTLDNLLKYMKTLEKKIDELEEKNIRGKNKKNKLEE
jgi:hypothetical protein